MHAEWTAVVRESHTVFQILAIFWAEHLPADEKMLRTFFDAVACVVEDFTRAITSVHDECTYY